MLEYLRAGTIKRVHVDRQVLARNLKDGKNDPACTVQTSKRSYKCREANILGNSRMMQAGEYRDAFGDLRVIKPLSCGARVWVETVAAVEVIT